MYLLRIAMVFRDQRGSFNTIDGQIKGITTTSHPDMNLSTVIIDQEYAAGALGIQEGKISQLMVRMEDRDEAVVQSNVLKEGILNGEYQVRSFRDASEMMLAMESWAELETLFIMALIMLVGAIGITNVVVLSALERV